MKTRLAFFAALAVLLAIAVTPANAVKPVKPVDIIKGPYLQQLTPNSIVIMWETNRAADSQVDYDDGESSPVSFYVDESVKIHEVQIGPLTGEALTPNTVYSYTVTSGGTTSPTSTFWTAPETERSFRFVAYGDTRTNANAHAAVIQAIIASEPEFVLHTGDLVSDGDNKNVWGPEFFAPAYDLMINTPLLPVIGNHEGSGNLFRDFFSLGDNDDWFAFSYSNVRFIGLNTHNRSYSPGSDQYNWLLAELTSDAYASADWHIVYFHHPPYTATSSHSDEIGVQTHLVPLFEEYDVDMVFNGHSHAYERYFNNGIYYIVTGGGGAPLAGLVDDTVEPIREFGESVYHHCVIDVDVADKSLTLSARYNSGEEFDTITLPPIDVTPPTASLLVPLDNGPDDLDADDGEVTVNTTQPVFDIQLSDVGDGVDDLTVTSAAVALSGSVEYSFSYNVDLDVITLAPTGGGEFGNGLYVITLSGIADQADPPNVMDATTLSILIDTSIVPPVTLSFQQGVDGYSGTVDTMLQENSPVTNNAAAASLNVDSDEPFGTDRDVQALVGFEEIFGSGPGQMPLEAQILSATLELEVTNLGHSFDLHEMLQSWSETATWSSMGDGIQADGGEAAATPAATTGPVGTGALSIDVTSSISAWLADPSANHGWVMLPMGADGVDFDSSEGTIPPKLIVTFLPGPDTTPPTIDCVWAPSQTTVEVVFSEPVDETSAELFTNYAIDQGVNISSATLQADTETVVLTTDSALSEGVTYTLTVNNVTDCATTPNPIADNTEQTFEYVSNPPVAYWALDEVSGTTAFDSSCTCNGNVGILKNGAAFTEFGRYAGAVIFDGTDDYIQVESSVTPPPLGLQTFTLAAWFKRAGVGDTANTGTGGFYGEPLVTKGRGEEDGDSRDMNYFLGLTQLGSDWVLAADFEEHITGSTPGLNHPVTGVTPIANDQWHHAAVTYDGSQWNLYLDGNPDGTSVVDEPPNYESIQFAAIGGALNSSGARDGAFNGTIDEVFIFEGALSQQEIVNLMGNLPPVADAGPDQTVTDSDENGFELITLDGFASSDPDGTIVSYEWDIDGDQITDYTGETVLDVSLGVGIHTVTLTIEDNEGATDSDDVVITVNPAPDTDPPTPDPMEWTQSPYATGSTSISMTATTATDDSGVEYYFACTAGGGNDSGWQDSPTYEDTGLSPNTQYTYTVEARDKSPSQNTTAVSSAASATTLELSLPGQATEPTPSDGQTRVNRNAVILSWLAGADAASHKVYLWYLDGSTQIDVVNGVETTDTTYDPPTLGKKTTYYWRIDEVNAAGTTTGKVWSFTTN